MDIIYNYERKKPNYTLVQLDLDVFAKNDYVLSNKEIISYV